MMAPRLCLLQLGMSSRTDCIRVLHELGADINRCSNDGALPFFAGAANDEQDCIRLLHELGADINRCSNDGASPLMAAAAKGEHDCIRLLHELLHSMSFILRSTLSFFFPFLLTLKYSSASLPPRPSAVRSTAFPPESCW